MVRNNMGNINDLQFHSILFWLLELIKVNEESTNHIITYFWVFVGILGFIEWNIGRFFYAYYCVWYPHLIK